jgi:hypothetical protein
LNTCKAPVEFREISGHNLTGVKEAMQWIYDTVPKHEATKTKTNNLPKEH